MNFNTNKFLNRMFRRVGGLVWDVLTGQIGLQTEQGTYTVSFDGEGNATLNVNPVDGLGLAIPAFATQATHEEVSNGDIIVGDQGIIGWVVDKTASAYKVLDHNGHTKTYSPPKVAIMNTQGVLVVRNLLNLTGGAQGANNFASNLLPLLVLGGSDSKLEKILPFLLMQSQAPAAGGAAAANPLAGILPFLMLKEGGLGGGDGKLDKLLPLMMMGGLGGAGGANPMLMMALLGDGDLLGSSTPVRAAPPVVPAFRGGIPALNKG